MRQEQFVARHQQEWHDLEQWLLQRAGASRRRRRQAGDVALEDTAFPQRYRRLCQQLALARERGYSPQLVQRLQQLMQQGHSVLYRTPPTRWRRAIEFLMADFPLLVRSQARSMWVALAMFALPAVGCFVLVQVHPDLIHQLMDNRQIAEMERMYDPAAERLGRDSGTDWMMFGHYIMNNISIALRTFASGLLAGLGTLLVLRLQGHDTLQQALLGDPAAAQLQPGLHRHPEKGVDPIEAQHVEKVQGQQRQCCPVQPRAPGRCGRRG